MSAPLIKPELMDDDSFPFIKQVSRPESSLNKDRLILNKDRLIASLRLRNRALQNKLDRTTRTCQIQDQALLNANHRVGELEETVRTLTTGNQRLNVKLKEQQLRATVRAGQSLLATAERAAVNIVVNAKGGVWDEEKLRVVRGIIETARALVRSAEVELGGYLRGGGCVEEAQG